MKIKSVYNKMEEEIQNYVDIILDMDFADYKIDWCFTAVYYYLHNQSNNNTVEIGKRLKMKVTIQKYRIGKESNLGKRELYYQDL